MTFRWVRPRLLLACLAVAAVPQVVIVVQALVNAHKIRLMGRGFESAADYAIRATFNFDTLGTLALWTLEIALVLYALAAAVLYLRNRPGREHRV